MNTHLNIRSDNWDGYYNIQENNLTWAFIVALKNEPNLLRDLVYLINYQLTWDEFSVTTDADTLRCISSRNCFTPFSITI